MDAVESQVPLFKVERKLAAWNASKLVHIKLVEDSHGIVSSTLTC